MLTRIQRKSRIQPGLGINNLFTLYSLGPLNYDIKLFMFLLFVSIVSTIMYRKHYFILFYYYIKYDAVECQDSKKTHRGHVGMIDMCIEKQICKQS